MLVRKPKPAVARRRRLGPRGEGRMLSAREYAQRIDAPGYISEIIDGVVRVTPSTRSIHVSWQRGVARHLKTFSAKKPNAIHLIATDCDVVIPNRPGETRPRLNVAAYREFPDRDSVGAERDGWSCYPPNLVVEVISPRRARKGYVMQSKSLLACARDYGIWDRAPSKVETRTQADRSCQGIQFSRLSAL